MLKNKKVLVTGGAGFIGSHLVEKFLQEDNFVVVLDNFSSGTPENLSFAGADYKERYLLIKGDIRDIAVCRRAAEGVDVVFHQAALRSVPKSMSNPYEYNEVNINGTVNILNAAKELGVRRVVFASSSSIYGNTDKFPETETDYPLLISPYALTKLVGEYYCRIFSENFGVETVSLRYFNVYGPRQALDDEYAVVIPKFITNMIKDEKPPVHGTGKQSRDFTYVDNIVQANLLAASASGVSGRFFNIADGKDYSVLNLVEMINKIMGKSIVPLFEPCRPGDVFKTLADITAAEKYLGYKSKVNFEEGIKKTVDWFSNKEIRKL